MNMVNYPKIIRCITNVLILVLLSYSVSSAEIIYLKTGKKIEGKIIEKTDKYLKIEFYGTPLTYFMDEIDRLDTQLSGIQDTKPKKAILYRVTKNLSLRALANLYTLQFRFPLSRKDLAGQKMTDLNISPNYNALITDKSGNEIAIFYFANIKGGETINVKISYTIEIDMPGINFDATVIPDGYAELTSEVKDYLLSEGDIDINNEQIMQAAESITGNIKNPYLKSKAIYNFIVKNIGYENIEDESGVQSIPQTLSIKRGNCSDITKLFIALARISGIPARQVDGVVFFPNVSETKCLEKQGHAWVEIYLPVYGWIPVDPTFGISERENYFCFEYDKHIKEFYGQIYSRSSGSLYRGSSIEARAETKMNVAPVAKEAKIEIDLLKMY
ncbi:MAG: transglutaminase domain-containing protein [Candidatus Omnitrophica bacterium]|nr:transglutaminase domain-containing protein [Candidatus Omnitrophota bacterium]